MILQVLFNSKNKPNMERKMSFSVLLIVFILSHKMRNRHTMYEFNNVKNRFYVKVEGVLLIFLVLSKSNFYNR